MHIAGTKLWVIAGAALLLLVAGLGVYAFSGTEEALHSITIEDKASFLVEIADEPEEQRRGLMYREEMAEDRGMLFVFDQAGPQSFWMKNTYIPLDILFITEDARILHIHKNAQPHDTSSVVVNEPVKAVLEINAGLSDRYGIAEGDRVVSSFSW